MRFNLKTLEFHPPGLCNFIEGEPPINRFGDGFGGSNKKPQQKKSAVLDDDSAGFHPPKSFEIWTVVVGMIIGAILTVVVVALISAEIVVSLVEFIASLMIGIMSLIESILP